jgi:hypothetical protein
MPYFPWAISVISHPNPGWFDQGKTRRLLDFPCCLGWVQMRSWCTVLSETRNQNGAEYTSSECSSKKKKRFTCWPKVGKVCGGNRSAIDLIGWACIGSSLEKSIFKESLILKPGQDQLYSLNEKLETVTPGHVCHAACSCLYCFDTTTPSSDVLSLDSWLYQDSIG